MNTFQYEILASLFFFLTFCLWLWRLMNQPTQSKIRVSIKLWIIGVAVFVLAAYSLARLDRENTEQGKLMATIATMAALMAIWCAFANLIRGRSNPALMILFSIFAVVLTIIVDPDSGMTSRRQLTISIYRLIILFHLSIILGNEIGTDGKIRYSTICLLLLLGGTFLGFRALYFAEGVFHLGLPLKSSTLDGIFQSSPYVITLIPILGFVTVFLDEHFVQLTHQMNRAERFHNMYETVRQCNHAIVRQHNRKELMNRIAEICVKHASLDLVWIGSPNADGWVDIEVATGPALGYVDGLKISIDENIIQGRGGTGIALREKSPVIHNEYDLFDPWSEQRNLFGLRSGATFPFWDHRNRCSCIVFYSRESNFFTDERTTLLSGLAADLGNALTSIGIRHLRAEALRHVRANRRLLNFALDSASDATWDWNISAGEVVFSRKWRQMLGYSEQDLPNNIDAWEKLIVPTDVILMHRKLEGYLSGESSEYRNEFRITGKDNRQHWIRDTGILISRDSSGRPLRMIGTMKVIDEEIRQQEILAESEKRFRLLAENAADLISRHDVSGVFLYVSPSFRRILGYEDDELIGKAIQLFIHPDDFVKMASPIEHLTTSEAEIRVEYRFCKKDRTWLWVESVIKGLMDEVQVTILELQLATREISERKNAEDVLRRHDQFLASVISSQINGIIVTNAKGTITFANSSAEEILELKFRSLPGKPLTDEALGVWLDIHGNPVNPLVSVLSHAIEKRQSLAEIEQGMRLISGKVKWLSISASPMYTAQNILTGAVISFIDISERISAQKLVLEQMGQLKLQHDAINSSNNGIVIADARVNNLPIIYSNKSFEIFSGVSQEQSIGVSLHQIPYDEVTFGKAKNLREAIVNRDNQGIVLKSLRENAQEFYFSISVSEVTNSGGEVTHLVAVLTDVSERLKTRKELDQITERLQLAVNGANLGIIDIDLISRRVYISKELAQKLGFSSEYQEFSVEKLIEIVHPEEQVTMQDLVIRHFRNEIPFLEAELRLKDKENKWTWFSVRGKIIPHSLTGKRRRFSGVLRDISERKSDELKIQELTQTVMNIAEKERAELSAELHDSVGQGLILTQLKILNYLKATGQRSQQTDEEPLKPVKDTLQITREISRRLSPVHMREVGIRAAVEDMILSAVKIANIKAYLELDALEDFFNGNWDMNCYRVIQEALTNTIKHANASVFSVVAERASDGLIIDISDDGQFSDQTRQSAGIGTLIMQERIRILNGRLSAEKTRFGFIVHVEIPDQRAHG